MGSFYSLCLALFLLHRISAIINSKYYRPENIHQVPSELRQVFFGDSVEEFQANDKIIPFNIELEESQLLLFDICFDENDVCEKQYQEMIFCYRVHSSTPNECHKKTLYLTEEEKFCGKDMYGFKVSRFNESDAEEVTTLEMLNGEARTFPNEKCIKLKFSLDGNKKTELKIGTGSRNKLKVCPLALQPTVTKFYQLEVALMLAEKSGCQTKLLFRNSNIMIPGSYIPTTTTTTTTTTEASVTIPPELELFEDALTNEGSLSKRWWIFVIVGIVVVLVVIVAIIGLKWRCIHNTIRGPFRRRIRVTAPLPMTTANPQVSEDTKLATEGTNVPENDKNAKPVEEAKDQPKPNPDVVVVKASAVASTEAKKENVPKPAELPQPAAPVIAKAPKPKPAAAAVPESSPNKKPSSSNTGEQTTMVKPDRKGLTPNKSCYQRSMRAVTAKPVEPPLPLNKTQSYSENEMTADELEYLAFCTADPGKRFRIFRAAVKTAERIAESHGYFLNARDPTVPEEEDTWLRVGADNLIKTCIELHGEPLPAIGDNHNDHIEFVATHSLREIYQVALYVELDDATRMYFLQAVIERFKDLLKKFTFEELEKCKHPMNLLVQVYKEHPEAFVTKPSRNGGHK